MADRDPLELLSTADGGDAPDPAFRSELLTRLLGDVEAEAKSSSPPPDVFELASAPGRSGRRKAQLRPLLLAAALALVLGVVALLVSRSDSGTDELDLVDTPTPTLAPAPTPVPTTVESTPVPTAVPAEPTPVVLPALPAVNRPQQPTITVELAQALLAQLGPEGLVLGQVEEAVQVELVTFDPNDPNRFMLADLNGLLASVPMLAFIDGDGSVASEPFDDARRTGGQFTRDGYVARAGSAFDTSVYVFDPNTRILMTETDSGLMGSLIDVEGSATLTLSANQVGCPFTSVNVNTSVGRHVVDERDNGFARVAIVQPGVGMAFPYGPDKDDCSPTVADETRAWSMDDGSPIDHPLAAEPIARAAVSGDGSRALVLAPDGALSLVTLPSLDVVAALGVVDALHTFIPLALNENGTIAAVADDDGTLRVWHADTGTLLLQLGADAVTVTDRLRAGAMLAYDAGRAALRRGPEDGAAVWQILTLDPNDWVARACADGFLLSEEERAASGIDPAAAC